MKCCKPDQKLNLFELLLYKEKCDCLLTWNNPALGSMLVLYVLNVLITYLYILKKAHYIIMNKKRIQVREGKKVSWNRQLSVWCRQKLKEPISVQLLLVAYGTICNLDCLHQKKWGMLARNS